MALNSDGSDGLSDGFKALPSLPNYMETLMKANKSDSSDSNKPYLSWESVLTNPFMGIRESIRGRVFYCHYCHLLSLFPLYSTAWMVTGRCFGCHSNRHYRHCFHNGNSGCATRSRYLTASHAVSPYASSSQWVPLRGGAFAGNDERKPSLIIENFESDSFHAAS